MTKYTAAVLTASDKGAAGEREDVSGRLLQELLLREGFAVLDYAVVPDERELLSAKLRRLCDELRVNLVLTTGGTGFSPRDITPEATIDVVERPTPGIAEAMRAASMSITPKAMLSRAAAGIRGRTLIINMPGSPKAVRESFEAIIPALGHGLDIMLGGAGECAR
ncbi:MAG: MogA/MoaB family molybdenum cofactor biosynthesis protein [Clostridiales bacterium]|nr:MogA/MoaB family molybdenum cofactor biosynthesis protein [Clostridiales bacterium]